MDTILKNAIERTITPPTVKDEYNFVIFEDREDCIENPLGIVRIIPDPMEKTVLWYLTAMKGNEAVNDFFNEIVKKNLDIRLKWFMSEV